VSAEPPDLGAYHELSAYTLAHPNPVAFIHQHVVDAFAAQHADAHSKPIGVTFALVGLYLHVEKGLTGRQVQQAHMRMARRKRQWPAFELPSQRGSIRAVDVIAVPPGPDRDRAIDHWCRSVWDAFVASRPVIEALLQEYEIV
jgi:hypothetical protein